MDFKFVYVVLIDTVGKPQKRLDDGIRFKVLATREIVTQYTHSRPVLSLHLRMNSATSSLLGVRRPYKN